VGESQVILDQQPFKKAIAVNIIIILISMKTTAIALAAATAQGASLKNQFFGSGFGGCHPTDRNICIGNQCVDDKACVSNNFKDGGKFCDAGCSDIVRKDNDCHTNVQKLVNTAKHTEICRDNTCIGPNVVRRVNDINRNLPVSTYKSVDIPVIKPWASISNIERPYYSYGNQGACGYNGGCGGWGGYGGCGYCGGAGCGACGFGHGLGGYGGCGYCGGLGCGACGYGHGFGGFGGWGGYGGCGYCGGAGCGACGFGHGFGGFGGFGGCGYNQGGSYARGTC